MNEYKGKRQKADFQRLLQDIKAANQTTDLNCDYCLENLDLYITDKINGVDEKAAYPQIWGHLQTCSRCRLAYQTLYETLTAPSLVEEFMKSVSVKPTLTPADLTFLQPQAKNAPWYTWLRSQLSGAPFNLTIEINPAYLQALFLQPRLSTVREVISYSVPEPQPLLHQILNIGSQKFTVDVTYLYQFDKSDNLKLEATLIEAEKNTLPTNLWASLVWGGQNREAPVSPEGYVNFGEVSLTTLKEAIETGANNFKINFSVKAKIEP